MTTKEYLNQYNSLSKDVNRYQSRIEQIESSLNKAIELDGMPRGTKTGNPTMETALKLSAIRSKLNIAMMEAELTRQTIADEIERMTTPIYKELLFNRYLVYPRPTWERITDILSEGRRDRYESKHVMGYMHGQALKEFERMRREGE